MTVEDDSARWMQDAGARLNSDVLAEGHADGGFHWRGNKYFKRLADGSVRVRHFRQIGQYAEEFIDWIIPAPEWASIVCSVSVLGEDGARWNAAQDFHGRIDPSPAAQEQEKGEQT